MSRHVSHEPVIATGVEVRPRHDEAPERLIKRFSKLVRADGILSEFRDKSRFQKPSALRRRKSARARAQARRDERLRGE